MMTKKERISRKSDGVGVICDTPYRYLDRVRSYTGTHSYEKALRKRKVWIEPLFGEAKEWHGMKDFGYGGWRR